MFLRCHVVAPVAAVLLAGGDGSAQCVRSESLERAVAAIYGPGRTVASLRIDDLRGRSAAQLERLYLACEALPLAELVGRSHRVTSLIPGAGTFGDLGKLSFRAPATTPDRAAAGVFELVGGFELPCKAYVFPSLFDGCDALLCSYQSSFHRGDAARRREELRWINPTTALGVALEASELAPFGAPRGSAAHLDRFVAIDLRAPGTWRDRPALGWPFAGPRPVGGPAPATWSRSFAVDPALYPFVDRTIDLRLGTLHYVEEGPANPRGTVLLLHGNPTWSFLYRDAILALAADGFRVVAPDLYGFGLSAKPTRAAFDHTPREHADVVEDFVQALDLWNVTLVLHDWSVPIGLALASRLPSRIAHVALTNGWAWNIDAVAPGPYHWLASWSLENQRQSASFLASGAFPAAMAEGLALVHGPPGSPLHQAVRQAYRGPFFDETSGLPRSVDAIFPTNQLAIQILVDTDVLHDVERGAPRLADRPTALLFGSDDVAQGALACPPTMPCPAPWTCSAPSGPGLCLDASGARVHPYLDGLAARVDPEALVASAALSGVGHFVPEHVPDAVASTVRDLVFFAGAGCTARRPAVRLRATAPIPGTLWEVRVSAADPGAPGVLLASAPPAAPTPLDSCLLHLDVGAAFAVHGFTTDAAGDHVVRFPIPAQGTPVGQPVRFQVALWHAGGRLGGLLDLTNALEVELR